MRKDKYEPFPSKKHCRSSIRAASFVEFIIAIVPILLIVAGIFDFARYLFFQHVLTRSVELAANELKKSPALMVEMRAGAPIEDAVLHAQNLAQFIQKRDAALQKAINLAQSTFITGYSGTGPHRLCRFTMTNPSGASPATTALDAALIMPGDSVVLRRPSGGSETVNHDTCPPGGCTYDLTKRGLTLRNAEHPIMVHMCLEVASFLLGGLPLRICDESAVFLEQPVEGGLPVGEEIVIPVITVPIPPPTPNPTNPPPVYNPPVTEQPTPNPTDTRPPTPTPACPVVRMPAGCLDFYCGTCYAWVGSGATSVPTRTPTPTPVQPDPDPTQDAGDELSEDVQST